MAGPVIPARYREALGEEDPLVAMFEAPQRLRRLLKGLTERQLARRPAPGKWSIKEIVAHLADGEVILGSRYRFTAAHERPPIQGYDQDLFVEKLFVENATTEELLADFEMARAVNLGLLLRLPDEAFGRIGVHAERGEESIETMVVMYAGHDLVHLEQVETIRTGLFPPKKKKAVRKGGRKPAPKAPARKASGAAAARPAPKTAKAPVATRAKGKVTAKPAPAKRASGPPAKKAPKKKAAKRA